MMTVTGWLIQVPPRSEASNQYCRGDFSINIFIPQSPVLIHHALFYSSADNISFKHQQKMLAIELTKPQEFGFHSIKGN